MWYKCVRPSIKATQRIIDKLKLNITKDNKNMPAAFLDIFVNGNNTIQMGNSFLAPLGEVQNFKIMALLLIFQFIFKY